MVKRVFVLALLAASAWAAEDAAVQRVPGQKLQGMGYETDAITIPQMLSYQGKLTDTFGLPVADTTYSTNFRLYNVPSGGSPFWNETQVVRTRGGLFSTLLGSVTPIGTVPDAGALYLGMAVAGGSELTPRLRIASAAYAYKADTANYALAAPGGGDNAWVRGTPDSVLFTVRRLGVARGGSDNMLHGSFRQSHVNLGVSCTTGVSGQNYSNLTIGGGIGNVVGAAYSTVAGGLTNRAIGIGATVAGGAGNIAGDAAADTAATVAGGYGNLATGMFATVGGGQSDTASGPASTVGGGMSNKAGGGISVVAGGSDNTASNSGATVGGGSNNLASGIRATVGGGEGNSATGTHATVGGGWESGAAGEFATVGGGYINVADTSYSTVGGGYYNSATGEASVVSGGSGNQAVGYCAAIVGGIGNDATGNRAFIGGGSGNEASGLNSAVAGGAFCVASGGHSFAAGTFAIARGAGSFVWSDSCAIGDSVRNATANRWVARARGGVYFYTNLGMTTGSYLSAGGSSWNAVSDSMTKENFRPVDKKVLLEALARMRVRDYNLKSQDASIRHIGPVAQDFHNAFGFGESNTAINMEDADGVLLAAVQALYEQNQVQQAEIEALKAEIQKR
jgi:hypothetical protein